MKYIKDYMSVNTPEKIIYYLELSENAGKKNSLNKLINIAKKFIKIFNKHNIDFKLYHYIRKNGINDIDFTFKHDITNLKIEDIDKLKLDLRKIDIRRIENLNDYLIPNHNDIDLYFYSKKYNL